MRALRDQGVDIVFGIPGTHNLEIYRAIQHHRIRHIAPRHEQGAGYAADAYARVSGRPGVVITTSGPGLTNVVTAAATSYADSIPVLYVSPGVELGREGADIGLLHEMKNQSAHLDAAVDRSIRVQSAEEAYSAIHETFERWTVDRRRPVHIEVPLDVLEAPYDDTGMATREFESMAAAVPSHDSIVAAARALALAPSVLVIAGGGSRYAAEQVRAIAERLNAPVVTTINGKGVMPENHPLSLGASTRFAETAAMLSEAEALLVIGSVLGDDELWGNVIRPSGTVVRIDIDARQMSKNLVSTHPLIGDASETLNVLLRTLPATTGNSAGSRVEELRLAIDAEATCDGAPFQALHEALREVLPKTTIIAGDSAQVSYFGTASQWPCLKPGQFVYPAGFATLGYGIPGGIGAALGAPGTPVVVIAGDGGTMFTIQEFATAVDLHLGLPVVVVNNGGFREIRDRMERKGIRPIAVDIRSPDFPLLGRALGGEGTRALGAEHIAHEVMAALERSVPTLIEAIL